MRRAERAIGDPGRLAAILDRAVTAQLAFVCGARPAITPMNFGYERTGGDFIFYFHAASTGRRYEALRENPAVEIAVIGDQELVLKTPACGSTCFYESVIAAGEAEFLDSQADKAHGLDVLMRHCGATGDFDYPVAMLARTAVFRVKATSITGKSNRD